ncbi:MAG TPA: NBR1-Ig-like domain-containing protein, partial [Anaerolineaceae bacterium]|nr:NBR1-Ig-like domain-containing protein [Anaerolineaceae bacterium]
GKVKFTMAIIALGMLVILAACNIPGVATKTNEQYVQEAMQTLQAKSTESFFATAIAQMTEVAKPVTATGAASTVVVTATPAAQTTPPLQVITVVATPTTGSTVPTVVILPQPTSTPKPVPCLRAEFVTDITVPDGTKYAPGTAFNKVWRLKNTGTCSWDTRFDIAFDSGDQMSAPKFGDLSAVIKPGQMVDFSVPMVAPATAGDYLGKWMLVNQDGVRFGVGDEGKNPVWVAIKVTGSASANGEIFSFAERAGEAKWSTGAGALTFPGKAGDYAKGYVLVDTTPAREDGGNDDEPGLITVPNNSGSIYIIGIYPDFVVKSGDVFQATIMCEGGATKCSVDLGLNYRIGDSGTMTNLGVWDQTYDGIINTVKVDLSALAGQKVQFILAARQGNSTEQMNALWLHPAIYRP